MPKQIELCHLNLSKGRHVLPLLYLSKAKLTLTAANRPLGSFSIQKPHIFQEYTDIKLFFSKTCKKVVAFP